MDSSAEAVVKDFTSILEELTFNSRPIITTLTKIAEENISIAQHLVDALESRIEKCVPKQKLYAFYVMDSICKNAGSPYTIYFSRNLFQLYKRAYLLVDNSVRQKLISMFKTWMMPNESTGLSLFDRTALSKIENFLIKASALHQQNFQSMLPAPSLPLLLKDIDRLTALTNERLKNQPNDEKLQVKLVVLSQLKQELQKEKMTAAALKPVQMQLMQVFAQDQQYLQNMHRQEQAQQKLQAQQQQQLQQTDQSQPQFNNEQSKNSHNPLFGNSTGISSLFNNASNITPPDFAEIERNNKLNKLQALYNSLNDEGMLFKPSQNSVFALSKAINGDSDSNGNDAFNNRQIQPLPSASLMNDIIQNCKAHFATVNIDVVNTPMLKIDQNIINATIPQVDNNLIFTLYRVKPGKCKLCGKRFGNTSEEQMLRSDHLDWHFRINKRIKGSKNTSASTNAGVVTTTSQKNIQSRNWYLHDTQWVNFKDEEIVSTSRNDVEQVTTANLNSNKEFYNTPANTETTDAFASDKNKNPTEIDKEFLFKKNVVVPESADDMSFQCSICKDTVTAVYDDETGEWVWRGCVESDGNYYHAICYYEAAKSQKTSIGIELDLDKLKNMISK